MKFPYEVESDEGGIWVYEDNTNGRFYLYGEPSDWEPAGPPCDMMVKAIRTKSFPWCGHKACAYHGPLREATANKLGVHR